MALSLYESSIPVFSRAFANLSAILDKGRAFADEKGIPHADLLDARLIADMAPLTAQIQRCSDTAKGVAVRVGQVPNVAMEDKEASFGELQDRIARTVALLASVPSNSMDGREDIEIVLPTRGGDVPFIARDYVLGFAIPNFFFHVTIAYALLRMKGVPIGKTDYLGAIR